MENVEHSNAIAKTYLILPKTVFWTIAVLIAVILPFSLGLSAARDGITVNNKFYTSADYFRTLKYTSGNFYTFGFTVASIFLFFFVLAILFSKVKWLKWVCLVPLCVVQFVIAFSYLMPNFVAHTYVVYGTQSWKLNAINIGILSSLSATIFLLVFNVAFVFCKRKFNSLVEYSKIISVFALVILFIIFYFVGQNHYIFELLKATGV